MLIEVSEFDLSCILGALSLYERAVNRGEVPKDVTDIATDMGDDPPTEKYLNRLLGRLDGSDPRHSQLR